MKPFLPFEVIAAVRFLLDGRRQTLLTVIGAAVGVSVILFMTSLLHGVQSNIFNRVLSTQAHIVISPPEEVSRPLRAEDGPREMATVQKPAQRLRSIDQWQAISARLLSRPDVTAVSPAAAGAAFAVKGDVANPVTLNGILPDAFYRIIDLREKIVHGSADLAPGGILIGTALASDLGLGIGEKIRIRTNRSSTAGGDQTFTIDGIFDLGNKDANERSVYVPLRSAQSLLNLPGGITSLSVDISDPYAAETVADELRSALGVNAESWVKTFEQVFTALSTQSVANYTIQFFVAVAVALGISSVLVVSVVQRSREIGILRAMGASRGRILRIFLTQGASIGFLGSLAGSILGIFFVLLWRTFARNPDGTEFFPVTMEPSLFIRTILAATVTGVITALLPALSAARLNPVDAIRG
ncbi:ABC transporter permease [Gellertiella hungarica]|uniref:Lipoprotein-releasing system permease protein n=1 Tax=Gellertiella hungarica TaxID=1572859 RepID=A0A7W6J503_9HYPH|nr:ABC transporter permease [Gellertiella hungarica]MBB4063978.1 lipoprotein-releasing system permease protein [Gellertiella hungarica]